MTMPDEGAPQSQPQEVARLLRMSPRTVKRWVDRGLLEGGVTLGRDSRPRRTDDEAVAERSEGRDPEL